MRHLTRRLVTVNASGEEKEVTVFRVLKRNESETPLPIKAYKKIIKRI